MTLGLSFQLSAEFRDKRVFRTRPGGRKNKNCSRRFGTGEDKACRSKQKEQQCEAQGCDIQG